MTTIDFDFHPDCIAADAGRPAVVPRPDSLVVAVMSACDEADQFDLDRTPSSILNHAISELGEIAIEINIENGRSYKQPGPNGVIGEAVDAIVTLLDLIHKQDPDITEEQIVAIAHAKCGKWLKNIRANCA